MVEITCGSCSNAKSEPLPKLEQSPVESATEQSLNKSTSMHSRTESRSTQTGEHQPTTPLHLALWAHCLALSHILQE